MYICRKKGAKSFRQNKYISDITEDNIEELFTDYEVYQLNKVTKENALEVQKDKILKSLIEQQEELSRRINELNNIKKDNDQVETPVVSQPVKFLKDSPINLNNTTFETPSVKYPLNPKTKKDYTQEEFNDVYNEFKVIAEQNDSVVSVSLGKGNFLVELTEDIKLAANHRGIPLLKKFF